MSRLCKNSSYEVARQFCNPLLPAASSSYAICISPGLGRVPDVDRDFPSIVVEFVSAGRRSRVRDYEAKRNEYGELGIVEYWIIDRFQRQMTVIRYSNDEQTTQVVEETGTYLSPLLPGFELSVGRLIAEADRFSSGKKA